VPHGKDELSWLVAFVASSLVNVEPANVDTAVQAALSALGRALAADATWLIEVAPDLQTFRPTHFWSAAGLTLGGALAQAYDVDDAPTFARYVFAERLLRLSDWPADDGLSTVERMFARSARAVVAVPIFSGGRLCGAIGCSSVQSLREWTDDDVHLLRVISDIFGGAWVLTKMHTEPTLASWSLDRSRDPSFWVEEGGRLLVVSDAASRVLGYSRDHLLHVSLTDIDAELTPQGFARLWGLMKERGAITFESRHRTAAGRLVPVEVSANAIEFAGRCYGFFVARDITERKAAETALMESREQMRKLAARISQVLENERLTIARRVHDDLGQTLTAIRLNAAWLLKEVPEAQTGHRTRLKDVLTLLDSATDTIRQIAADLRPGVLDELGLLAAIEWEASRFERRAGIRCDVVAEGSIALEEGPVSLAVFRVFQEILTNVARHAQAKTVHIQLSGLAGVLCLRVVDDGIGIAEQRITDASSLGLMGMRERIEPLGGTLSITGRAGAGTCVEVRVPIASSPRRREP